MRRLDRRNHRPADRDRYIRDGGTAIYHLCVAAGMSDREAMERAEAWERAHRES
jgi:hypothetical protein